MRVLHLAPGGDAGSGIAAYGESFRRSLRTTGLTVDRLESGDTTFNTARDVAGYVRRAVATSRAYDIVHAELGAAALRQYYAALAVAERGQAPVFATVHDPPQLVWFPLYFKLARINTDVAGIARRIGYPIGARLDARFRRKAAGLFVLTQAGVESVAARLPRGGAPVTVLPYPRRVAVSDPAGDAIRASALTLGFVGFWSPGKGIEDLIRCVARLRVDGVDVRVRLWGEPSLTAGPQIGEAYRTAILECIDRHHVGDVVSVEGFLPEDKLLSSLATCDAVVLPYSPVPPRGLIVDSTSAAIHDAHAAGVPVVCADTRAIAESSEAGATMLYEAGDLDTLTELIRRLAVDPVFRADAQAKARRLASTYDPTVAGRAALAAYEQVRRDGRR